MSNDYIRSFSNFVLHLFILTTVASIETTIFSSIGIIPHTDLWVISIVYFSLHRDFRSSFLFCLLASLIVGAFTAAPYSSLILGTVLVTSMIHFIKNRSYIEGIPYFMLMSLGSILLFYFTLFVSSWLLYEDPISSPKVLSWFMSALISPLFAAFLRFVFWFIDTLTNTKQPFGFEVR